MIPFLGSGCEDCTRAHEIALYRRSAQSSVIDDVGRGGAFDESIAFNRRVLGSTPALDAT